jgi:hypothetical protein
MIGGAASGVLIVGQVIAGFIDLTEKMRAFADRVVDSNARLSRWNSAIASAYMFLGVNDFRREVAYGRATQGTAITAVRAVDQMRDAWQGVDQLRGNVNNRAAAVSATLSGAVGADLSRIANIVNDKLQQVDPNGWVSSGIVAGVYGGAKGFVTSYLDGWMNHPFESALTGGIAPFIRGLIGGWDASAKAADAAVANLAAGAFADNFWGNQFHAWKAGPMLPRATPRRP